jgi:beta-mannosidase
MINRKMLSILALTFIIGMPSWSQSLPQALEINQAWKFHRVGSNKWYNAIVPGCVHTDLLANKLIVDPFFRDNESKLQWIDKNSWEYKTILNVDNTTFEKQNVELCFKGLDTYADVFLNDQHILSTDNMFREWNVSVKQVVVKGDNILRILFHSPIVMGLLSRDKFDLEAPVGYNMEFTNTDWPSTGPYIRKAAYMYGWDWGPKLTTSGIWRPVILKSWDKARINSIQIIQHEASSKKADISAILSIESTFAFDAVLNVTYGLNGKRIQISPIPAKIHEGMNEIKANIAIDNPALWWPNGMGDHPLYEFTGSLSIGANEIDRAKIHSGIRTVKLIQKPEADGGKSFCFEVNGIPVFAKGSNYIPSDIFPSRVSNAHYEELIKAAADANMNMLRVWGGGIYENDIFYDLCDQYGILIWQDFAFASLSPDYPEFYESVQKELKENIQRLRNHPCIALWCGNNEIDLIWNILVKRFFGLPIQKEGNLLASILPFLPAPDSVAPYITKRVMKAYDDVFYKMIPEALEKYDFNSHDYWPSSPMGGWREPMALNKPQGGDMHYYVAYVNKPFSGYQETQARFFSEHGFQAWPDKKAVNQFTNASDRTINSTIMQAHNKAMGGNSVLDKYINMYYHYPKDFDSYLYISQVLQAEGMKFALETHRRWMPYTMGSLYWQLNDVWPVASWSSLDYQNNPKALHFMVKKAFSPVIVVPSNYQNDFSIHIVSDKLEAFKTNLEMKIIDFNGKILWRKTMAVNMASNTSQEVFKIKTTELIHNFDTSQIVFIADLIQGNKLLASNQFYFSSPKDLKLQKAQITKVIKVTDNGYSIMLTSDKLVKNLFLSTDEKGRFSDNYFDLLPGEKVQINFTTNEKIEKFEDKLILFSLIDSY